MSSSTTQVPGELENATANTFEDWMISSANSWPASPFYDAAFMDVPREYNTLEDYSWSACGKVATTDAQAGIEPDKTTALPEAPHLAFTESIEGMGIDMHMLSDDFGQAGSSAKPMSTTEQIQRHGKAEEENVKLEPHLEQPAPAATLGKPPDTPRETGRDFRPRRMSMRAPKSRKATKKELSGAIKASEVSSKRRKHSHDGSRIYPAQNTKCRPTYSPSNSSASSAETRTNHNLIEKQYRNRLNIQFESLMGTLPKGVLGEKKAGKAEVLVHANKYIQELEKELKEVEERNAGLQRSVKDLERKYYVMAQPGSCEMVEDAGISGLLGVEACVKDVFPVQQ